jgi:hypothetical protein
MRIRALEALFDIIFEAVLQRPRCEYVSEVSTDAEAYLNRRVNSIKVNGMGLIMHAVCFQFWALLLSKKVEDCVCR